MKDELVKKIQHVLDRPITNEMQLVYLLVELRKLMDRDGYKDPVLRMFCNWVVHTSLENRAQGSTLILNEFDELMIEVFDQKTRALASTEPQFLRPLSCGADEFFRSVWTNGQFSRRSCTLEEGVQTVLVNCC